MGWAAFSKPGDEYGPCAEPCDHGLCATTRGRAESNCTICGKPIGYETKFYSAEGTDVNALDHALCVWLKGES